MFGAYLFAHAGHGIFAKEGGWELVGALGAGALALAGAGAGRFSIDALLGRDRRPAAVDATPHTERRDLVDA